MKKNVHIAIIVLVLICACYGLASYIDTHYTMECKVVEITPDNQVFLEDTTNNTWVVYANGVAIGDEVKATFNTQNTPNNRYDDIIEKLEVM